MDVVPKVINLKEFLIGDKYKKVVEYIRAGETEEEIKKRKTEANLPAICISARFNTRNSNDIKTYNSLICLDIDYKDNKEIMNKVPAILKSISNVVYYGKSVSGTGYFCIIPIAYGDKLLNHFWALQRDFKQYYNIVIDKACKDYTRLRFASFDENYYINPNVECYNKILECEYKNPEVKKEPNREAKRAKTYSSNDFETVSKILNDCKTNNVDITGAYADWDKVCLALIAVFKETDINKGREYFHLFSKLNKAYSETECNSEFDKMLDSYKDNNKISVASLVYLYGTYSKNE
jgi:hypothetical protein